MIAYRPVLSDNFNVYTESGIWLSAANGIEIPELNNLTETVDGAGVLGEYEEPALGMYESMTLKIPFTHLNEEATSILNTLTPPELQIRGAIQGVTSPGSSDVYPIRVVVRGKSISFAPGKLVKGKKSETEASISCLYLKIEIAGKTNFELDKLNYVCIVNGVDVVAKARSYC